MKKIFFTIIFSVLIIVLNGQNDKQVKQNQYDVNFNTSQGDAMFPGGNDSMMTYIWAHLNYPEEARNNGINGTVQISFDVNFDGKLKNFQKLSNLGYGLEDELIRVVQTMPTWIPATINNIKVKQQFILSFPISRYNQKENK